MKSSMEPEDQLIHYNSIESLNSKPTEDAWELVEEIKNMLNICEPRVSFPLQLAPLEAQERKRGLLKEFEKEEHILKITADGNKNPVLIKVDRKKFEEFYKRLNIQREKKTGPQPSDTVTFDSRLCILKYGNHQYNPRRNKGRAKILTELWKHRKTIDSTGGTKQRGSITPLDVLGIAAGFQKEQGVRDAIQDIRDKIKEMKFPIEIIVESGCQLIVRKN